MRASFLHLREHWTESRPGVAAGRVVLSELPRGDSPIACHSRCLNFVLDGVEQYEIDGRVLTVRAGEFILVEAGTAARAILPMRQITRGLCVYLPDRPGVDGPSPLGEAFQLTTADNPFSRRLRHFATDLAAQPERGAALADAMVHEAGLALEALTADLAPRLLRIEAAKPATRRQLLQKLERVRCFLHDHPNRTIALPELAEVAAMSPFHLARLFRAVFDEPPAAYHRRLRIELAARDLRHRDLSVADVADRYGFADASSFSRAYRRVTGSSPRAA